MPIEIRLLIVEDDDGETKSWQNTVEAFNAQNDNVVSLTATFASSADEARQKIGSADFDAAVIDIRLKSGGEKPDTSGNEILRLMVDAEMAVVAAYTGEAGSVEIPEGMDHVQTFAKGRGQSEVVTWLSDQADLIRHKQLAHARIRRELAGIFTRSVWPRWKNWAKNDPPYSVEQLGNALARHITSHVLVSLLNASNQKAHAEEWYFVPPLGDTLMTGDLVGVDDRIEVVITPRCDIATNKYEAIQLATCEPCQEDWAKALEERRKSGKSGLMRKLFAHNNKFSEHFLPPITIKGEQTGPFLVKFAIVRSISKEEASALMPKRLASIAPVFLPALIQRLGTYISRIGAPDDLYLEPEVESPGKGASA